MAHSLKNFFRGKTQSSGAGRRDFFARKVTKGTASVIPGLTRINRPTGGVRSIAQQIAGVGKRKRLSGGGRGVFRALGTSDSSPGSGAKKKLG